MLSAQVFGNPLELQDVVEGLPGADHLDLTDIGVTNDLIRRVYEHREHVVEGFTESVRGHAAGALRDLRGRARSHPARKNLKKWPRAWKLALIEKSNPQWIDLYPTIHL